MVSEIWSKDIQMHDAALIMGILGGIIVILFVLSAF